VPGLVVFVTDYGTVDSYAAALIGAVWRVDQSVQCVDGTHDVPPGDALAGAYHVKALAHAFAPGIVLCAVVDPEVGTARRAVAATMGGIGFVGPDTGLLSYLWQETGGDRQAVALPVPATASATFAGRDVFAPAAGRLATGTPLEELGEVIDDPVMLRAAFAEENDDGFLGCVAVVDHFGNAITTVRGADLGRRAIVGAAWDGGAATQVVRTYAEIEQPLAVLMGSSGHVEIAARGHSAAESGAPPRGAKVHVLAGP
jgi:S-adenosyl-L-methionine hydrolase (adenosine-forming)